MIKDITIGQYYPQDSIIHRLDPRIKIISTFLYVLVLFICDGVFEYALVTLFLAALIKTSRIPVRFILKGLKPVMMILIFTIMVKVLFSGGMMVEEESVLFKKGILCISTEGIRQGVFLGIRFVYLVIGTSMLTYTTTPNSLATGLESVMKPLKIFKVPVAEAAMILTIALRFIPILVEEADRIMKAQMSRGADFEEGNVVKRVKSMAVILIPLFVSAFRRANDLAAAMEARCYHGGEGRTRLKPLKMKGTDYGAMVTICLFVAVLITVHIKVG